MKEKNMKKIKEIKYEKMKEKNTKKWKKNIWKNERILKNMETKWKRKNMKKWSKKISLKN